MLMNALGNMEAPRLPQRYRLIEPRGGPASLGEGAYGIVYKALDTETMEMVALKKIRLETEADGISSSTLREITLLMQLNHENVVKLQNVSLERERMSLVFELLELDLRKYLDRETEPLPLERVQSFSAQLLSGLAYCHSMGVMHRDLKPHNILISQREGQPLKLKIADFGLARTFTPFSRPLTMEVITRWYRAPEVILGHNRYTCAVDLWSIGCIIAEISNKRALFMGDCDIDQLYKIFRCMGTPTNTNWPGVEEFPYYRNNFPEWTAPPSLDHIVPNLNEAGVRLLECLFRYDPRLRITAKDALRHSFVHAFVKAEDLMDPYLAAMMMTPTTRGNGASSVINSRSNTSSSTSTATIFHSASTMASSAPPVNVPLPRSVHNAPISLLQGGGGGNLRSQMQSPEDTEVAHFMPAVGGKMSRTFLPIDEAEEEHQYTAQSSQQQQQQQEQHIEENVLPYPATLQACSLHHQQEQEQSSLSTTMEVDEAPLPPAPTLADGPLILPVNNNKRLARMRVGNGSFQSLAAQGTTQLAVSRGDVVAQPRTQPAARGRRNQAQSTQNVASAPAVALTVVPVAEAAVDTVEVAQEVRRSSRTSNKRKLEQS